MAFMPICEAGVVKVPLMVVPDLPHVPSVAASPCQAKGVPHLDPEGPSVGACGFLGGEGWWGTGAGPSQQVVGGA